MTEQQRKQKFEKIKKLIESRFSLKFFYFHNWKRDFWPYYPKGKKKSIGFAIFTIYFDWRKGINFEINGIKGEYKFMFYICILNLFFKIHIYEPK